MSTALQLCTLTLYVLHHRSYKTTAIFILHNIVRYLPILGDCRWLLDPVVSLCGLTSFSSPSTVYITCSELKPSNISKVIRKVNSMIEAEQVVLQSLESATITRACDTYLTASHPSPFTAIQPYHNTPPVVTTAT